MYSRVLLPGRAGHCSCPPALSCPHREQWSPSSSEQPVLENRSHVPPRSSLQIKQTQVFNPPSSVMFFRPSMVFYCSPRDSLQRVHILPDTRRPQLAAQLQLRPCRRGGNAFPGRVCDTPVNTAQSAVCVECDTLDSDSAGDASAPPHDSSSGSISRRGRARLTAPSSGQRWAFLILLPSAHGSALAGSV